MLFVRAAMDFSNSNKRKKRKVDKQFSSVVQLSSGNDAEVTHLATLPSQFDEAPGLRGRGDFWDKSVIATPTILSVCRTALMHGPTATRAILARHRKSIDPDLTRVLETVGGYTNSVKSHCTIFKLQSYQPSPTGPPTGPGVPGRPPTPTRFLTTKT